MIATQRNPVALARPQVRSLRVLHVIPSIAPRYGGPSTALLPMVQALNDLRDVRADIATTDADGAGGRFLPEQLHDLGPLLHLFRRSFSERWKFSAGLWSWLRRHVRDYDLLHVHALWTFSTAAACAAARRHGIPVIVRPCGMLSAYTWGRTAWQKRLYWSMIERRNLNTACRFHVTSVGEAAEVARLALRRTARTVVIPHGVEPAAWQTERQPERLRQLCGGRAGERPIILFLSRLHPKKGLVDLLLPALARLRSDAFLAIAGGADDHAPGHEAEVRAAIDTLRLNDRVAVLGRISPTDRWSLFDGAAVFALPSHSENFGIVVAEAMARGTPVVVSEEVQSCEHVNVAKAGRVVPLDVDALAGALDELLVEPIGRAAIGERGWRYARDHFCWDQVALRIRAMYEGCLRGQ